MKERCEKELAVEEYFGLPESIEEKEKIVTDYGQLVSLLYFFCERYIDKNKNQ